MAAIDDIAGERRRQIEVEGWSIEHDDLHASGELARVAAAYALPRPMRDFKIGNINGRVIDLIWPPSWGREWFKPRDERDRRRDLVRAGALIVAEIERLDRAAIKIESEG